MNYLLPLICTLVGIAGVVFSLILASLVKSAPAGSEKMVDIANAIKTGAIAYLNRQLKSMGIAGIIIFVIIIIALGFKTAIGFLVGAAASFAAGYIGMRVSVIANVRTAEAAKGGLAKGLSMAFKGGSVTGMIVAGLALTSVAGFYTVLIASGVESREAVIALVALGFGGSLISIFARLGGGIFTKGADVGADLVGKVEAGIPEDDPRNPATIADNVGDNVGDVAGMGADLYESYCGSILATAALGVAAFASGALVPDGMSTIEMQLRALFLPMVIAGVGILLSIAGVYMVRTEEDATQKALLKALARGIDLSCIAILIVAVFLTWWLLTTKFIWVAGSIIVGLGAGWIIGKWTEYATSDEFNPTKKLADQSVTGPATLIIGGIADGMLSVWVPVITVRWPPAEKPSTPIRSGSMPQSSACFRVRRMARCASCNG